MGNWQQKVRENLAACLLPREIQDEVVVELASHLEEAYEEARAVMSDDSAIQLALKQVGDWRALARNIRRAKSEEVLMNSRTKSLWLPALMTLLGASSSLALFEYLGARPHLVWVGKVALTFYWAWLATLPIFGAMGAYLSRRQSSAWARLAAGVAPALGMLIVMGLILPWGLAIDGIHFFRLVSFGLGLTNWVLIPAVALLAGVAPFLRPAAPGAQQITTRSENLCSACPEA
jgi:hypothetical protein